MRDRIKDVREHYKLSQVDFAKRIPISGAYISQLESGDRNITERMIKFICKEFGIRPDWLRYGTGEMFEKDDIIRILAANIDGLDDMDIKILSEYLKLNERNRAVIKAYIRRLV